MSKKSNIPKKPASARLRKPSANVETTTTGKTTKTTTEKTTNGMDTGESTTTGQAATETYLEARVRREVAQVDTLTAGYQQRLSELVARDTAADLVGKSLAIAKRTLDTLIDRVAPLLAIETDPVKIRETIGEATRAALEEIRLGFIVLAEEMEALIQPK